MRLVALALLASVVCSSWAATVTFDVTKYKKCINTTPCSFLDTDLWIGGSAPGFVIFRRRNFLGRFPLIGRRFFACLGVADDVVIDLGGVVLDNPSLYIQVELSVPGVTFHSFKAVNYDRGNSNQGQFWLDITFSALAIITNEATFQGARVHVIRASLNASSGPLCSQF